MVTGCSRSKKKPKLLTAKTNQTLQQEDQANSGNQKTTPQRPDESADTPTGDQSSEAPSDNQPTDQQPDETTDQPTDESSQDQKPSEDQPDDQETDNQETEAEQDTQTDESSEDSQPENGETEKPEEEEQKPTEGPQDSDDESSDNGGTQEDEVEPAPEPQDPAPQPQPEPDQGSNDEQQKPGEGTDSTTTHQGNLKWEKVVIPGIKCGNGDDYVVFIDNITLEKDLSERSKKVVFMLQGGGVCYDKDSCEDHTDRLKQPDKFIPYDGFENGGLFSGDPNVNKFLGYSKIFLPYCTGDVFLGNHVANYGGLEVNHGGKAIVEATLKYLADQRTLFSFPETKEILLFGFSAGAIGALSHLDHFSRFFHWAEKKTVVADSPGLHFGKTFWHKYSDLFLQDVGSALATYNHPLDRDSGLMTTFIPKVCRKFPEWNFAFIQSTDDLFMSVIHGDIEPEAHAQLVLGEYGIVNMTADPNDNCASWVEKDNSNHVYLIDSGLSDIRIGGVTPMEFVWKMAHSEKAGENYLGSQEEESEQSESPEILMGQLN